MREETKLKKKLCCEGKQFACELEGGFCCEHVNRSLPRQTVAVVAIVGRNRYYCSSCYRGLVAGDMSSAARGLAAARAAAREERASKVVESWLRDAKPQREERDQHSAGVRVDSNSTKAARIKSRINRGRHQGQKQSKVKEAVAKSNVFVAETFGEKALQDPLVHKVEEEQKKYLKLRSCGHACSHESHQQIARNGLVGWCCCLCSSNNSKCEHCAERWKRNTKQKNQIRLHGLVGLSSAVGGTPKNGQQGTTKKNIKKRPKSQRSLRAFEDDDMHYLDHALVDIGD